MFVLKQVDYFIFNIVNRLLSSVVILFGSCLDYFFIKWQIDIDIMCKEIVN